MSLEFFIKFLFKINPEKKNVFMKHFSSFLFFLFIRNLTQVPEFGNHLLRDKSMLQAYFKLTFRISASISEPDVVG